MSATKGHQRGHSWRRLLLLGAVAMLVLLLAAAFAAAGQKDKDRSEPKRAVLLNKAPTLHFVRGTLRRDANNGWTLNGDRPVLFTSESLVRDSVTGNQKAFPAEGRVAILSGHYAGASLVVHTCTLRDPYREQERVGTLDLDANPGAGLPTMPVRTPQ